MPLPDPSGTPRASPSPARPSPSPDVATNPAQEPASSAATLLDRRSRGLATSCALAAAGGYLDAFTYVGHGGVFANAMTGNVVLLAVDAIAGSWRRSLGHLLPILMFLSGAASSRLALLPGVRRWVRHPRLAVLAIEILALFGVGWLPASTSNFVITMSIAFLASVQTATFSKFNKLSYNSTFTTGNLRTMVETGFDWLFAGRQAEQRSASIGFAAICVLFLLGAAVGAFITPRLHNRAIWLDVAALVGVLLWLIDAARKSDQAKPQGAHDPATAQSRTQTCRTQTQGRADS